MRAVAADNDDTALLPLSGVRLYRLLGDGPGGAETETGVRNAPGWGLRTPARERFAEESAMIPPQVHRWKPCYDFYFL